MTQQRTSSALGFQIAFLIFAVVFLNAPLEKYIYNQWIWARDANLELGRAFMIISGGILLATVPGLRRRCADLLAPHIPRGRRREVVVAVAMDMLCALGAMGAFALWTYQAGGEPALARAMGSHTPDHIQMERAFSPQSLLMFVFVAGLVAPIVEELAFRGFLYQAWKAAWGWLWAALASAFVFGLFHGTIVPQFLAGIVYVVAMRRSGSLRGAIYAHALFNLLAWFPLLGQFMLPAGRSTGELHLWTPHLVCLALATVLLPVYVWSARDARLPPPADFATPALH